MDGMIGGRLFRRPKLTLNCGTEGKEKDLISTVVLYLKKFRTMKNI
jgi:hypothetical protein